MDAGFVLYKYMHIYLWSVLSSWFLRIDLQRLFYCGRTQMGEVLALSRTLRTKILVFAVSTCLPDNV